MSERLKFEGRLGELEREAKRLELVIKGIVSAMRDLLDPLDPVADLKGDVIFELAAQLAHQQSELKAVLDQVKEAKRILGR